jgi:hypothetical protein
LCVHMCSRTVAWLGLSYSSGWLIHGHDHSFLIFSKIYNKRKEHNCDAPEVPIYVLNMWHFICITVGELGQEYKQKSN